MIARITNKYLRSIFSHIQYKKILLMNTNIPTVIIICLVYHHRSISFFLDRVQYEIVRIPRSGFFLYPLNKCNISEYGSRSRPMKNVTI